MGGGLLSAPPVADSKSGSRYVVAVLNGVVAVVPA
jgi:hypothetical protein